MLDFKYSNLSSFVVAWLVRAIPYRMVPVAREVARR